MEEDINDGSRKHNLLAALLLEMFGSQRNMDLTALREVSLARPILRGQAAIIVNFDDRPGNNGTNR